MNTTALPVRPDVAAFVARVRDSLADLSEDDRLELTEGLEADLTDQVAEHGGAVLGDPEAYAGEEVCNIAAYDASGQPLVGVQLFDQRGRPLDVQCFGQAGRTVPWVLGDVTRWNVFPLGVRARPARTPQSRADLSDAAFPTPDRTTTPEVTNPLVPELVEVAPEKEPAGKKDGDRTGDGVNRR